MKNWYLKNFLNIEDSVEEDIVELLNLASQLKKAKQNNQETQYLKGKNIALIFEKTSTRTRCAFEVAAADQGASTTYLGPGSSQLGEKESTADTASVLGRFYDAIEYRGFSQETVNILAKHASVPILNGLTDLSHPTQMLADLLTMQENSIKPISQISFAYLGDARFNMGNSLLLTGALMGMDVRIAAPKDLQPQQEIIDKAKQLAKNSGARIMISDDPEVAVKNVDFIHTDIWVSMGESKEIWQERLPLLMPYRIDGALLEKANNPELKFMHCLPAYHDRETAVGEKFYETYQLNGIEVADEVFSGSNSLVFSQAENRMHTIKALLVAVLSEEI